MKKYSVNVHCDVVIPVDNIIANSESEALKIALERAEIMPYAEYGEFQDFTEPCVVDEEDVVPIMDTSNSHNGKLVELINREYYTHQEDFKAIVSLLMKRDKEECEENNVNGDIHSYLMHVADDEDLECILKYLKVWEI